MRSDAAHAQGVVLRQAGGGGCGRVALRGTFNGGQGVDGLSDHGLHARLGAQFRGIRRCGQGGLHTAEVGGRDAADAQRFELNLVCSAVHHGLHGVGQGLQFGDAVHVGSEFAVDDFTQQADFFRGVHAIDTDGGVLRCGWVGIDASYAIGCAQNEQVRVYQALHLGRGVGLSSRDVQVVQGAVHRRQVLRRDARHTQGRVVRHGGVGGGGVVELRGILYGRLSALISDDGVVDDALQLAERSGARAIVWLGPDGVEHGEQVVGGDACQAQCCQIHFGQCGRGCAPSGQGLNGVGQAGQGVELGDRVHTGGGLRTDDAVEQGQVFWISPGCAKVDANAEVLR